MLKHSIWAKLCGLLGCIGLLTGCAVAPTPTQQPHTVTVQADGRARLYTLPTGALVRDALQAAQITLNPLDRVNPAASTPLQGVPFVQVIRVTEQFETEVLEVPFEKQTIRNEGLPDGEERLLQVGQNGREEVTYRIVLEDGAAVNRVATKRDVLQAAIPEITMLGVQTNLTIIPISGHLAYLSAGNAWLLSENSGNRKPLTVSGDLDGRVFQLSADGEWLLFTRTSRIALNELWVVSTTARKAVPRRLVGIEDVLWAAWQPTASGWFAYSTGESRLTPPGWKANNDLWLQHFAANPSQPPILALPPSSGGVYGWYGTRFSWNRTGTELAYSQAAQLGLLSGALLPIPSRKNTTPQPLERQVLAEFAPFQTNGNWVWQPEISWSTDEQTLYTVLHAPPIGLESPESSPAFDLAVLARNGRFSLALQPQVGLWAAPVIAPQGNQIAFLKAILPLESTTSRYQLAISDRDGSDLQLLFPPSTAPSALLPQTVAWHPLGQQLAVVWEGNLWVVAVPDRTNGANMNSLAQQITADGVTSQPTWSP